MQNKYRRWYDQIIAKAKTREVTGYSERHHIVPRSLGGSNASTNIVALTYREHFLVHWLLVKFTKGEHKRKMLNALGGMRRKGKNGRIVSGWQYEIACRSARKFIAATDFSKMMLDRWSDPDFRKRATQANRNRALDPQNRDAQKRGGAKRASDPKWIANSLAARRLQASDPVYLANASKAAQERFHDPAKRAIHDEAMQRRSTNPNWLAMVSSPEAIKARTLGSQKYFEQVRQGKIARKKPSFQQKVCKACGTIFQPRSPNGRFCNPECWPSRSSSPLDLPPAGV